jgi:hypothetical protein
MSIPISDRIASYRAWLNREPVERPMLGLIWEPDIPPLPEFLEQVGAGTVISPDQIQVEMFLPCIERWHQRYSELVCDVIQSFAPAFGIPWVETIAGCPVVADPGSLWADSFLDSYVNRPPICFDPDDPWLRKLIVFTQALVEFADGRFPVALPQTRGPLDTLAAMRTPERMCVDFVECPDEVFKILGELTDLWIGINEAVLEVIPPFHGGHCTRMNMWAPGKAITPQNDISTLISPEMYEEFVLPWDREIVDHFPYHCFHLHSTEYHQVDVLLKLEKLTAIELTLENTIGGPPLDIVIPVVRRILSKKPLLLCALDIETAERCLDKLPSAGLCMTIGLFDYDIPRDYDKWLEKHCSSTVRASESCAPDPWWADTTE